MRSAIHTTFGEPAEVLVLGEVLVPKPGQGQVLVRTILSPIHNHDLDIVRGNYGYKPELPGIGGSEAVGIVEVLGEGVTCIDIGQRIAVAAVHGTWAEYFLAPASGLVPIPDAISDESAAQLLAMPFSAITLLEHLEVESGDWVIQNAANGAVGKTLAMLAKARGVNIINLVRRDAGVDELLALGIPNVVSTATNGWQDRVYEIIGEAQIRAAVDSIAGEASDELLTLLGENGVLVSFGRMSGEPMHLSTGSLAFKHAVVKGFWAAKVNDTMSSEVKGRLFSELLHLVVSGELKLPVEAIFRLDQIRQAIHVSLTPGKVGKVLIKL
ncbi:zinc-binding dehydrogenase [Acinetobacter guillouiae]|uniref:zinc-binding dehydrogenase n=1 Tax=Acinetobacter guillouiae TaxID=106649 RepID=UPI002FDA7BDD